MNVRGGSSRNRIIASANNLIYTKGYNQMSFADVAAQVGITKGNLYYHFKSKEELLEAVVTQRMDEIREGLHVWEQEYDDVKERLKCFVKMMLSEEANLVRYGCPMGTLNMELGKSQTELRRYARQMFDEFLVWLKRQFAALGMRKPETHAKHLLSMAQGAALMCFVYEDGKWLRDEAARVLDWIDSL